MSLTLRIILIVSSVIAFILCVKKVKQSKLQITDSVIWIIGSFLLILMSIFSGGIEWIATKIGVQSPVNFLYLIIIAFLLVEIFIMNIRIATLNEKIKNLNHYIALNEERKDNDDE